MWPEVLAGVRVGSVSFLNARPLVHGLDAERIVFEVPARLAEDFAAGHLEAALMPVFAILHLGGGRVADDIAIACRGAVTSVMVASRDEFARSSRIHLDPASRSSSALLRVLLAEYYPGGPQIVEGEAIPDGEARLIIGDPALAFRKKHGASWKYHDLGELWQQHTGLPFVFAMWALGGKVKNPQEVAAALRAVKCHGLAARAEIAAEENDPAAALDYLTNHIRYDVGEEEKKALNLFAKLAHKHGLLDTEASLVFV